MQPTEHKQTFLVVQIYYIHLSPSNIDIYKKVKKIFIYEIYRKHTKLSVSGENIQKALKVEVVGIFSPNLKKI